MKPVIKLYTDNYSNAMRLFNTLFRPAIDNETVVSEEKWFEGECLVVERNMEVFEIYMR